MCTRLTIELKMENIRVDRESGQVILLQVLNEARPGLHRQGTSRILRRVLLEKYPITKMRVNSTGNPNIVGTLEACVYLLDNIPGVEWDKWRQESAYEFKKALIEHVERKKNSTPNSIITSRKTPPMKSSMDVQSDSEVVEVETKTQLMQKHLQAADMFGNIRVAEETGMGSAIDVIRLMEPGADPRYAGRILTRLLEQEEEDLKVTGQSPSDEATLKSRIFYVQINGKGHVTPVADANTIVQIMWMVPSKAGRAFRRKSAGVVCQALGGDMSLCKEIEERHYRLQSSEEGQKFKTFMTCTGDNMEIPTKFGPSWFELASDEEKKAYVSVEAKKSVFNSELEITKSYVEALEMVGQPLDDRDKIEVVDRIKDSHRRAYGSQFLHTTETSNQASTVTSSETSSDSHAQLQVCNAIDISTGLPLATPKCPLSVRGSETSIPLEAAKLNVRVGERSGLVGRETRKLYGIRYGQEASRNIPKRSTIFRGKPWSENTYYARDSDLIQRAIRNICGC